MASMFDDQVVGVFCPIFAIIVRFTLHNLSPSFCLKTRYAIFGLFVAVFSFFSGPLLWLGILLLSVVWHLMPAHCFRGH